MVDSFRCSGEEKIWLPVGQCQLTFDPFNKVEMKRIITLECLMQREGPNNCEVGESEYFLNMQWSVQVKTLSNSNKWVPVWILEKSATLIKKIYANRRAVEISDV